MGRAWVVGNEFSRSFLGLVKEGGRLAREKGLHLTVACVWKTLTAAESSAIANAGGENILHLSLDGKDINAEQVVVNCLADAALKEQPVFVLFENSAFFCSVAPALSARLGCGITADCTELRWNLQKVRLQQVRPTFGGRRIAVIETAVGMTIATVCKGVFHSCPDWTARDIDIVQLEAKERPHIWTLKKLIQDEVNVTDLTDADIILSGGLGIGSKENFGKIFRLASYIGAGVGASRAAVAAGYITYDHQIGQTGVSVRPKLYLAFGISGAVQHLSGMIAAEKICAINTDPKAPIHDYSDFSVIADCNEVLDQLLKTFE